MIFSFLYHVGLSTWIIANLPKIIKRSLRSKVDRELFIYRMGLKQYPIPVTTEKRIWIHSVSLGETKAVEPLIAEIKQKDPTVSIICSHSTMTGLLQSQKNKLIDYSFLLPIDFSWIMKKLVKQVSPTSFILVETDFWPNLLKALKKHKSSILLVNGKLSNVSFSRLKNFSLLAKRLFSPFDVMALQNEEYLEKFKQIGLKEDVITITGNIKYDIKRKKIEADELESQKQRLFIKETDKVIVFGCTHEGEEEIALNIYQLLKESYPNTKWIIAPRHPHRFDSVKEKITQVSAPTIFSSPVSADIILVDQLGVLDLIYQMADISILCGSLVPGIGGHNLFEPLDGNGVLMYGNFVDSQKEMDMLIQKAKAAIKISKNDLKEKIQFLLDNPEIRREQVQLGRQLAEQMKGSTQRTFKKIEKFLWK